MVECCPLCLACEFSSIAGMHSGGCGTSTGSLSRVAPLLRVALLRGPHLPGPLTTSHIGGAAAPGLSVNSHASRAVLGSAGPWVLDVVVVTLNLVYKLFGQTRCML